MTLAACDISVQLGKHRVLNRISFTVTPGEMVAIVGPNGAGKSSLLRVLAGDLRPATGAVTLAGRPLTAWHPQTLAQHRAVLPQSTTLPFAFQVHEVVLLGRAPHVNGYEHPHDYTIAAAALELVGMGDFGERVYTTLSGGEQQRVQLARVLAQIWEESTAGHRYLLLDEPTNNLDLTHQHRILQIARQWATQGVGVLAILHDLNLAAQYVDTVLVMKAGCALACGSPQATLTPALISEAFAMPVVVIPHPHLDCPLIVASAPRAADTGASLLSSERKWSSDNAIGKDKR